MSRLKMSKLQEVTGGDFGFAVEEPGSESCFLGKGNWPGRIACPTLWPEVDHVAKRGRSRQP